MAPHEEFLELCAAATAGELTADEQSKLEAHLSSCPECRKAMAEYEAASQRMIATAASSVEEKEAQSDADWSLEEAEQAFFKRLETEDKLRRESPEDRREVAKIGQRFTYRPSQLRWREVWMSLAAVVVLGLALTITAYRTGMKRGTDIAQTTTGPSVESVASLEQQVSDANHERGQLLEKMGEQDKLIADLRRQLSEQQKAVATLKVADTSAERVASSQQPDQNFKELATRRDQELVAAQAKLQELQKNTENLTSQRDELASRASALDAKVGELSQLLRNRTREVDQKQEEVARLEDLLQYDRDVRELMSGRELHMVDVHDVFKSGTAKTFGRVFFAKGKRLIFYAFDLDAQPGFQNASFQAWGRRGPDKLQARSLGILYEDNASKRRWVLKADDPKTLEDIDAVFVTIEPNGGSQHPSGKQLLFAYLGEKPSQP
jgi:hypothetical protein